MSKAIQWYGMFNMNHHPFISLPELAQEDSFSCGPAVLKAILYYYGIGPASIETIENETHTSQEDGTSPNDLSLAAAKYGLKVEIKEKMTINQLKSAINSNRPVVCAIQAYGDNKSYKDYKFGHYVIAIDYDDKNIYFQDPNLHDERGYLPVDEFLDRWHDKDKNGKVYSQLGIIIWDNKQPEHTSDDMTTEKISSSSTFSIDDPPSPSEFKPDYTAKELHDLNIFSFMHEGKKPYLSPQEKWPDHWLHPQDPKGWLQWYDRYDQGRRTDDDQRQVKRWLSFKKRHSVQFQRNPTPRHATALMSWAIDPYKLISKEKSKVLRNQLKEYTKQAVSAEIGQGESGTPGGYPQTSIPQAENAYMDHIDWNMFDKDSVEDLFKHFIGD